MIKSSSLERNRLATSIPNKSMLQNYADQMLRLMDNENLKKMIESTTEFRSVVENGTPGMAWSTLEELDEHLQRLRSDVDMFYRVYEGLIAAMPERLLAMEQSGEVKREEEGYVAPSAETAPQSTNQVEQQVELTTFSDDKAVIEERMVSQMIVTGGNVAQHTDAMEHSVVSFLRRPQLVGEAVWLPGGGDEKSKRGVLLFDVSVPNVSFTQMVLDKLDGFTTFKATAVMRLQVNTQPFQCGRLLMAAIPMPSLIQPRDQYMLKHPSLLQAVNHVQMDISKQTEVTLRVPFVSPFNAYDLIHNQYPWARLAVMVYSPLNVVEQVPLEVLLWSSFEDVELGTPTSATPYSRPIPMEQAGLVANLAGNALSSLTRSSEQGESSGGIGGLVKSGTDLIGGVGSLLGFSKPINPEKGSSVFVRPTNAFANVDSGDPSHVLSLEINNVVDEFPGLGGTSADEMSLDFIKRIPQYVKSFSYSTSSSYGTELFRTYIAPTYNIPTSVSKLSTGSESPGTEFQAPQPTALHYAISPFQYWTGSIVYTFRFVKTDYHSGRVEVSFHPFADTTRPSRIDYTYRVVADLREKTELSVTVPFVSPTPWKVLSSLNPLTPPLAWQELGPYFTGVLSVRALTPLITASTIVSKDIECLVEVRGGPDFRVCSPIANRFFPVSLVRGNRMISVAEEQGGEVFAIPGTQETREAALEGFTPQSITGNVADISQSDTQKICAGETFENYRALTRRFAWTDRASVSGAEVWNIKPYWYIKPPLLAYGPKFIKKDDEYAGGYQFYFSSAPTPVSFVSGMYAFYRGGTRYKVYSDKDVELISARVVSATQYLPRDQQTTVNRNFYPFMSPAAYEMPRNKRFAEFQVPYYSPTIVSVHWDSQAVDPFSQPMTALDITTNDNATNVANHTLRVAFAGADDFGCFSFLGAPFCVGVDTFDNKVQVEKLTWPLIKRFQVDPAYSDTTAGGDNEGDLYIKQPLWASMNILRLEPEGFPSVQNPKPGTRVHRQASPLELRLWFGKSERNDELVV